MVLVVLEARWKHKLVTMSLVRLGEVGENMNHAQNPVVGAVRFRGLILIYAR